MIDELIDDLKREEGWRPSPYRDTEGFLTIGFGFLIDERKHVYMPRRVGELWLEIIAEKKWMDLLEREPWLVDQPEDVQRALAQMAYQMGVDGVLGFENMIAELRFGNREGAADEALDSKWARQTPERAQRVAALIRGDNDVESL